MLKMDETRTGLDDLRERLEQSKQESTPHRPGNGRRLDIEAYLAAHNRPLHGTKALDNGATIYFTDCPGDPNHNGREAGIIQFPTGAVTFQCKHDGCKGFGWAQARKTISGDAKLEPWMIGGNGGTGQEIECTAADPEGLARSCAAVLRDVAPPEQFDISVLPPILADYVRDLARTTVADPMLLTQSVLATTSAFLKKRAYMPEGIDAFQKLYPNLWMLSVCPSGSFKTTGMRKGMRLAYQQNDDIDELIEAEELKGDAADPDALQERVRALDARRIIFPNRITPEAMMEKLAQGFGGMIFLSELSEWLKNMEKSHNADLKQLFTDFYDGGPYYRYCTKNHGDFTIREPLIVINAFSNPRWVAEDISETDVSSGFLARFLLLSVPETSDIPPARPQHSIASTNQTYERFRQCLMAMPEQVEYRLADDAGRTFDQVHDRIYVEWRGFDEESRERLEPYVETLVTLHIKARHGAPALHRSAHHHDLPAGCGRRSPHRSTRDQVDQVPVPQPPVCVQDG